MIAHLLEETLRYERLGQPATQTKKYERGRVKSNWYNSLIEARNPEGIESQGGNQPGNLAKPQTQGWASTGELNPEGGTYRIK